MIAQHARHATGRGAARRSGQARQVLPPAKKIAQGRPSNLRD
jgi:hypothetical protein